MKTYFLTLLGASVAVALVGILAPNASSKHIKWISSLFFICVLISPLPKTIESIRDRTEELTNGTSGDAVSEDYGDRMEEAVNSASKTYFAQTLTQMLEQRFSIPAGEIRCSILWEEDGEQFCPSKITLILSGSTIWKNPADMENFVTNLLGCECVSAIE